VASWSPTELAGAAIPPWGAAAAEGGGAVTGVGSERASKAMRWGRGGRDLMLREADSSGFSLSHGYPARRG